MLGITMFNEEVGEVLRGNKYQRPGLRGIATLELKDGTSWELVGDEEDMPSAFGIGWDELNEWSTDDLINAGWEPV